MHVGRPSKRASKSMQEEKLHVTLHGQFIEQGMSCALAFSHDIPGEDWAPQDRLRAARRALDDGMTPRRFGPQGRGEDNWLWVTSEARHAALRAFGLSQVPTGILLSPVPVCYGNHRRLSNTEVELATKVRPGTGPPPSASAWSHATRLFNAHGLPFTVQRQDHGTSRRLTWAPFPWRHGHGMRWRWVRPAACLSAGWRQAGA